MKLEICRSSGMYGYPVKPGSIVSFVRGLPGFEDTRRFRFTANLEAKPFMYMDAIEGLQIGFVCVDSFAICPSYRVTLNRNITAELGIENEEDVSIMSIVTVGESVEATTANLMSPIVINRRNNTAEQVILENSSYSVRYSIWDSMCAGTTNAEEEVAG